MSSAVALERTATGYERRVLLDDASVTLYSLDGDFPKFDMPAAERRKIMAQFAMMNVYKAARFLGLKWGPDFIEHIGFPIWCAVRVDLDLGLLF